MDAKNVTTHGVDVDGGGFMLEANRAPIELNTADTVVIVVDMQHDFGSKGGMFDRAGVDIAPIQGAVAPTARVLAASRAAGLRVVYLKMAVLPDLSDVGTPGSPNYLAHIYGMKVGTTIQAPDGREGRILVRDTWNTDIVEELKPEPGDTVIYKSRFSGFYKTELDETLKKMGARVLLFTGCTTSVCVESTVRDAMFRDYCPVVLADCTAEPIGLGMARSNHEASLFLMQTLFGWVSDSGKLIASLESGKAGGSVRAA